MIMKKTLVLFLGLSFIISCSEKEKTKEEKIKESITSKLKEKMKDPASFKFVNMNIKETFSVKNRKETINAGYLDKVRKLNEKMASPVLLKNAETEYTFLQQQTDEYKDAVYRIDFTAKGSNSFGGIIQSNYSVTVINDDSLTVLNVSKN